MLARCASPWPAGQPNHTTTVNLKMARKNKRKTKTNPASQEQLMGAVGGQENQQVQRHQGNHNQRPPAAGTGLHQASTYRPLNLAPTDSSSSSTLSRSEPSNSSGTTEATAATAATTPTSRPTQDRLLCDDPRSFYPSGPASGQGPRDLLRPGQQGNPTSAWAEGRPATSLFQPRQPATMRIGLPK